MKLVLLFEVEERMEIDLSVHSTGIYFIVISDGKNSWTRKIVIE